jgi:hypothetical protein
LMKANMVIGESFRFWWFLEPMYKIFTPNHLVIVVISKNI